MKRNSILIFTLLLCMIYSCVYDRVDLRKLNIENKSSSSIYCSNSTDERFSQFFRAHLDKGFDSFRIDSTGYMYNSPRFWDDEIKYDSEDNHLRIFIISQDLVDSLGWKKIIKDNIYSKVYKLNMDSIEARNWTIVYE